MISENDRLRYLRGKVKTLQSEIVERGLQGKYRELAEQIADGKLTLKSIDEDAWDLMLPEEQSAHLLAHYHTVRSELHMRLDELKRQGTLDKITRWLEQPVATRIVTAAAIVKVAVDVILLLHHTGLFFTEDRDSDQIV